MRLLVTNIFLAMTLVSYLASLLVMLFNIEYDSAYGLPVYLLMISTSIIRFGIVNNILFDFFGLNLGSLNILVEAAISIPTALGADFMLRRTLKKYGKLPN